MLNLKIKDKVIIKNNLENVLQKLDFQQYDIDNMKNLIGTIHKIHYIFTCDLDKEKYAILDFECGTSIPIQCLELINNKCNVEDCKFNIDGKCDINNTVENLGINCTDAYFPV